jgi:hypothetical protein
MITAETAHLHASVKREYIAAPVAWIAECSLTFLKHPAERHIEIKEKEIGVTARFLYFFPPTLSLSFFNVYLFGPSSTMSVLSI